MFWVMTAFSFPSRSSLARRRWAALGFAPRKLLRVRFPEGVAQDGLGRVVVFLMVEAVHAAEIRDAALGGHTCTAKKDDVLALRNDFF